MRRTLQLTFVLVALMGMATMLSQTAADDDKKQTIVLNQERSEPVVSTTLPFADGKTIPDLPHQIIKLQSLTIKTGKVKKGRQKVLMRIEAQNFGTRDYYVIITATLEDEEGKAIAVDTDKEDFDRNDREDLTLKLNLSEDEVARAKTVRLEMSYLED